MEHNKENAQDFFDIIKKAGFRLTKSETDDYRRTIEGEAEHGNPVIWEKAHEKDLKVLLLFTERGAAL